MHELRQGLAVLCFDTADKVDFRGSQGRKVVALECLCRSARVPDQGKPEGACPHCIELEFGSRQSGSRGAGIERERRTHRERSKPRSHAAKMFRLLGSEFFQNRDDAVEALRIKIKRHCPAWRMQLRIDASFDGQGGAAEITYGKLLDINPMGIDARLNIGLPGLDAQQRGMSDGE